MQLRNIGFIGAGNMAQSIIGGIIHAGFSSSQIWASDQNTEILNHLQSHYGIHTDMNNKVIIEQCDVIILAVKPNIVHTICEEIKQTVNVHSFLLISIAAGITTTAIKTWLGDVNPDIVRCMPNTPALLQAGASGLYTTNSTSVDNKQMTESIFSSIGIFQWVKDEPMLDTVTALSGSGPAYFFLFIESMVEAAVAQGLDLQAAEMLAKQTAYGAAKMALNSQLSLHQLRLNVTSPGGTTEKAIQSFQASDMDKIVLKAMQAALIRSQEIAASTN